MTALPRHGIGHDIRWFTLITRMAWMHLPLLGVIWFPPTPRLLAICAGSFLIRGLCVTMGFHRYFAHRSFNTSRTFQFIMAFLGTATVQHGVLWWAAYHRDHHRYSDKAEDIHSPYRRGFWWSHMGWFLANDYAKVTRWERVKDWSRFPELVWLNKHWLFPPLVYGLALLGLFGWDGFFWGAVVSTVLIWHITFSVNSLTHMIGHRRYPTTDRSRNSLFVALLTFGEGWHNNHHYFPHCAPQGFYTREIDLTMALIWLLEKIGIVWDVQRPDAAMLAVGRDPATLALAALQEVGRAYATDLQKGGSPLAWEERINAALANARSRLPGHLQPSIEAWRLRYAEFKDLSGDALESATEEMDASIHRLSKEQVRSCSPSPLTAAALPSSPIAASS